jgi:hypothetical protein
VPVSLAPEVARRVRVAQKVDDGAIDLNIIESVAAITIKRDHPALANLDLYDDLFFGIATLRDIKAGRRDLIRRCDTLANKSVTPADAEPLKLIADDLQ